MKPLLEIKNLSVSFINEEKEISPAVQNISVCLYPGEILGIVGESGSGKSVTALSVMRLLPPGKTVFGAESTIKLCGQDIIKASNRELQAIRGAKIGFVFQEPMSSLNPLHKIGFQIAESILIHQNISQEEARKKAIELLKMVGIDNSENRYNAYPFELSGGQRQRVMIAMAIANNPQILIADEPTTALDVTVQEQIINTLIELKNKLGMSVLFISHDLSLVRKIANRIVVMYCGKIVESAATEDLFPAPKHEYTQRLLQSSLSANESRHSQGNIVAQAENITVSYPLYKNFWGRVTEELKAVNDVSLAIYGGQTLGIVGESGSGKTTLGMCLANLIKFNGNLRFNKNFSEREMRRKIQIVFQDPYNSLNPRLNILQIVGEGLSVHFPELSAGKIKQKVVKMLEETGLSADDLAKYPHQFSGGQRQRIAIARALILEPELVILDEPTSALDITVQSQIIDLLKSLQKKLGIAYVFISHDMRAVKSIADTIAVMKDGKILEINDAEKIFTQAENPYTRALIKASKI